MKSILDRIEEETNAETLADEINCFIKDMPEALETIIKANEAFLEKFADLSDALIYTACRETARAYKKKNLVQSNYPYDSDNYREAASYYLKAYHHAPDNGRKLSSLDGAASMYWNLDDKEKWRKVKLLQAPLLSAKDKTRLYMDIARELPEGNEKNEMYRLAMEFAPQMSGDDDIKAEMIDKLQKLLK